VLEPVFVDEVPLVEESELLIEDDEEPDEVTAVPKDLVELEEGSMTTPVPVAVPGRAAVELVAFNCRQCNRPGDAGARGA
jgi:hypothetical protein